MFSFIRYLFREAFNKEEPNQTAGFILCMVAAFILATITTMGG